VRVLVLSFLNLDFGGGAERWIGEIAERWALEHQIRIVTTTTGPRRVAIRNRPAGIEVSEIATLPYTSIPTVRGLAHLSRLFEWADVVYFVYQPGGLEVASLLLQYLADVPVIAGHHGSLLWYTTEPGIPHLKLLFAVLGPRAIKVGKHLAAHQATNQRDYDLLAGLGAKRLYKIPSAIDTQPFSMIEKRAIFTMAFTGSFVMQKGVDRLPTIFRLTRERIPDVELEFTGDGPVRGFLREFPKIPNVRYLGFVPLPEQRRLVATAHVYLLPSRFETFSRAAMESMAAGTPVVAMRVAGVEDYIVNGENGFVADDLEGFVAAIDRIHSIWRTDRSAYLQLSSRCRETALRYDWSRVIPRMDVMLGDVSAAWKNRTR
jgi:glycosyltransferase involved in cell wall biosynthesis